MSIQEDNGNTIVTMGTVNAMAFKVLIWIGLVATPAAFVLFWNLDTQLQLHDWRIAALERQSARSGGVTQSVNVGDASSALTKTDDETSAKTWLTVQEVAKREHVTDRSVLNYIEAGLIDPEPQKNGKSWVIAENYRIVPKDSASCGTGEERP